MGSGSRFLGLFGAFRCGTIFLKLVVGTREYGAIGTVIF